MAIPVIDLFAGPGGLGEGFSSVFDNEGERVFETVLSVEMEMFAHQTLTLRNFYRKFRPIEVPEEYYQVLRAEIEIDELYQLYPEEARAAANESKNWKLGYDKDSISEIELDKAIIKALNGNNNWVLTGGPPCQAYSVVGRSRLQRNTLDGRTDDRVTLYKHYLRIIKDHRPAVFVMENVKGMLSARSTSQSIFERIMKDLKAPGYRVYSLVKPPRNNLFKDPEYKPEDFVIRTEEYGIPQGRHRVILLGIRDDFYNEQPSLLKKEKPISLKSVIDDLPKIRSGLSKQASTWENWSQLIYNIESNGVLNNIDDDVKKEMLTTIKSISNHVLGVGSEFIRTGANGKKIEYAKEWFFDPRIGGFCNHESRGHMDSDIYRYLFVSCFGKIRKRSPKLSDFPSSLLPAHKNACEAIKTKKFADRFRVQLKDEPAKTITSHISKDGHYYIHYDPTQCRSLTVREAARIQTFPDNYFFCGPRTAQYVQVGNAVPPLLAKNIAKIVVEIFTF